MNPKILIATGNPGKVKEFRTLFDARDLSSWEFITLKDLSIRADVDETGSTYKENAALKARAYAKLSGLPTISDDSGLEVAALGGAPGIRSARYSPQPGATDADRRQYLLQKLAGKAQPWDACFCCVVAIVFPDGDELYGEGKCPGEIISVERGKNGFGYDPIFQLPSGHTMAELDSDAKNQLSHRALAVRKVRPFLIQRFQG